MENQYDPSGTVRNNTSTNLRFAQLERNTMQFYIYILFALVHFRHSVHLIASCILFSTTVNDFKWMKDEGCLLGCMYTNTSSIWLARLDINNVVHEG